MYNFQAASASGQRTKTKSSNRSGPSSPQKAAEAQPVSLNINNSSHTDVKASQGAVMLKQMSGPLQSLDVKPSNDALMHFYRTSNLQNPGAGDYVVEDTMLNLKNQSPRPTIGRERRFYKTNEQMVVNYKDPVPVQHINDAAQVQNKKPQLGYMGTAPRMHPKQYMVHSPGVGSYNIANYTSYNKANQTNFASGATTLRSFYNRSTSKSRSRGRINQTKAIADDLARSTAGESIK